MDKELSRRQIVEEVQAQYEKKLREAKQQKSQAEEELETASERWRNERRKLNAEIDRLEGALAEAKAPSKRKGATATGVEAEEIAKIKTAAEERFNTASGEWKSERTHLESQVSRLEEALVEALERSSNPIRSVQPIKENFERQLSQSERDRIDLEQEYLRAKAVWDEEKKKLTGELIKLRRMSPKALEVKEKIERLHGRKESVEETRIKELEEKLEQANTEIQKYHQASLRAKEETKSLNIRIAQLQEAPAARKLTELAHSEDFTKEREDLESQIRRLKRQVTEAKDDARTEFETRLERAARERIAVEDQLAASTQKWETERRQFTSKIAELERSADASQASADKLARLQKQLASNTEAWETERGQLNSQINELRRNLTAAKTAEAAARTATDQREELEERLAAHTKEWNTQRRELTSEIAELKQALTDATAGNDDWRTERRELKTEITELQESLAEAQASSDKRAKIEERLAANAEEWDNERRHLDSQIVQLQQAVAHAKDTDESAYQTWASEREELQNEIQKFRATIREKDEARDDYELRLEEAERGRVKLEERIASVYDERDDERRRLDEQIAQLQQAIRDKDQAKDDYERRLEEAEQARMTAADRMSSLPEEWAAERQVLKDDIAHLQDEVANANRLAATTAVEQWAREREELQDRIQELNQAIVRTKDEAGRQYESRLEDANQEITRLEVQIANASKQAETNRNKLLDQVTQLQQEVALAKNSAGESLEQWAKNKKGGEIQKLRIAAVRAKEEARLQYESRLEEAFHERGKLEEQMTARSKQLEAESQQLRSEITELQKQLSQAGTRGGVLTNEEWMKEREDLQNEIRSLQRSFSEGRSDDIVDQLRKQYDQKLQDMIEQKTQISNELLEASRLLESERERFGAEIAAAGEGGGDGGNLDTKMINAEVTRVERVMREITSLIDDPSTELSMVIRKNVEKAELDAYLKGILFSIGRAKGMDA